ncbi:hypothetical protein AB3X52_09690 [Nocardioides sp. DS6]|uniref:Uncharacterized protein n=1 Tax=Nocardioides eburneus TaxID=3231482 RepID=A0ABV3SZR5_9ACTN
MTTPPPEPGKESAPDAPMSWYQHPRPLFPPPPAPPRRSRRRRTVLVAAVAGGVLILAGAGWGVTTAVRHQHREQAAADAEAAHKRAITTCRRQIGDFVADLRDIDAKLDVGMNEADYGDAVREASAEGNDVVTSELSSECDSAYDLADRALTIYAGIESDWNECLYSDWDCDADTDVDFSGWADASDDLDEAYAAMLAGGLADEPGAGSQS